MMDAARLPAAYANPAYDRLADRFARIATIEEAQSVLGWDAAAMMPDGGAAARGDQMAVLAGLAHGLLTDPHVADELGAAEAEGPEPDPWRAANLRLMRHAHTRATAVPAELVEAQVRANAACEMVWREARRAADFAMVRDRLDGVLRLVREQAAALAPALGLSPYDALMDGYQPGMVAAEIAPVFAAYEAFLRDALPRAEERQAGLPPPLRPRGPFPAEVQEALCRRLATRAGLEPSHSRLDRSAHPFCGGTPTDVRITTRYDEADFSGSLMGVMHETGHALYERGLPTAYARQPVGRAAGMAAHESQSLIVEMQACRSDPYLGFLGGPLREAFGGQAPRGGAFAGETVGGGAADGASGGRASGSGAFDGATSEAGAAAYDGGNLACLLRSVKRSFIRVDADELTYPAHVILRFRLEQDLVAGDLDVADLPGAWNDGMRALLGIVPPDDAKGCLQDIHWYDGGFGYFPSYTLGAMAAAQLMAAARRALPTLDASLAEGDLAPLVGWLRQNVHGVGSRLGFNDLLRAATGKPLDPSDFQAHLTARYLG